MPKRRYEVSLTWQEREYLCDCIDRAISSYECAIKTEQELAGRTPDVVVKRMTRFKKARAALMKEE